MKSDEKQMSNSFKKICASSVTIREFDEYDKCLKVLSVSYQNRCKTLLDGGRRRVKKFMEFF